MRTTSDLIYLVNAANDESMAAISNDYSFPALGVLSLGTWLKNRMPDLGVICRDGAVWSSEKIIQEIHTTKPSLVGISTLCTSYQNSLEIAKEAKNAGAKVVFGNDQAAQISKFILQRRPYVDYVVGAEYGELDLELLVRHLRDNKVNLSGIPTLTYRDSAGNVKGFDFERDRHKLSIASPVSGYQQIALENKLSGKRTDILDIFPIVDRTLYPEDHWQTYLGNYLKKFRHLHTGSVTGVTVMNRARGCNRQDDAKCKHCDMLLDISMSSPEMFWQEVRSAHEQVKATSFYEACDSLSSFPNLITGIAKAKPYDLGFKPDFFVYCQAADLEKHPERVDMLKDIGVFRVNMGLESMSDRTLKHLKGLNDSVEKNYKALQLLKDKGIHVYGSFVLGSELETTQTLRETTERVCGLIKAGYLCDAEANPITPLYRNYPGAILRRNGLWCVDPQNPDWPVNIDQLSKIYIDTFSGVKRDDCIEAANIIRKCASECRVNFGSGISRKENYKV